MSAELSSNNSTTNCSGQQCQQIQSNQSNQLVVLVICWAIITVGVIGNSLVIAVVKMIRSMRTTTNYLLVNVASADITTLLFVAIHLITRLYYRSSSPVLDSFLCKFIFISTVVLVSLLVTTLTLTVLAVERYHAMLKPLTASCRLTTDKVAYVILGIWLVAIAIVTPLFVIYNVDPKTNQCSLGEAHDEMVVYIYCLMVIMTMIPFIVIAFCYSQIIYGMYFKKTICNNKSERRDTPEETREKRRLVRLLILLTAVFFVAFIPYSSLYILKLNKINNKNVKNLQYGAQFLTLLNCSLNPFIYALQSVSYRRSFVLIFKKMFCRDTTVDAIELREIRNHSSLRSV